jgi:hypothetical protein
VGKKLGAALIRRGAPSSGNIHSSPMTGFSGVPTSHARTSPSLPPARPPTRPSRKMSPSGATSLRSLRRHSRASTGASNAPRLMPAASRDTPASAVDFTAAVAWMGGAPALETVPKGVYGFRSESNASQARSPPQARNVRTPIAFWVTGANTRRTSGWRRGRISGRRSGGKIYEISSSAGAAPRKTSSDGSSRGRAVRRLQPGAFGRGPRHGGLPDEPTRAPARQSARRAR